MQLSLLSNRKSGKNHLIEMKNMNINIHLKEIKVLRIQKLRRKSHKFKLKKMNGYVNIKIVKQSIKLICQKLLHAIVKNVKMKIQSFMKCIE
jgi:hypothetical protein